MKKRMTVIIIILVVIFGGTFIWDFLYNRGTKKFFASFTPPPVTISTANVKLTTWNPTLPAVGTLVAVNGVEISPEVSGQATKIYFKSGEMVHQGQPLVQLDDDVDQQTLKTNESQLNLNSLSYHRQLTLFKRNATSADLLDRARAQMVQSEAAVATAKVMIDKKLIKAPFDGKLGIRKVNLGEYVSPGLALVTIQSLDPLFVDFSVSEQMLSLISVGQPVRVRVDAYPSKVFSGVVTAISSKVDVNTRTLSVRAKIPNPDKKLLPGIFADVEVLLPTKKNVLTLPQTAISFSLYGNSVYVVKNGVATAHFVKVGVRQGNKIAIVSGVKAGEEVVISGQLKLFNGAKVKVNNSIQLNQG